MLYFTVLTTKALLSFCGTLGFAILYNVPRRALFPAALIGMGGNLIQVILSDRGVYSVLAMFLGSLFVGVVGTVPARRMQLPMVLFAVTGIICMIPGTTVYKVFVYFGQNDIFSGLQSAIEAAFGIGALACGIGVGRILTDREWGFE
jgi:uncharacterized membrane protein YjjB (DUF3815 family)